MFSHLSSASTETSCLGATFGSSYKPQETSSMKSMVLSCSSFAKNSDEKFSQTWSPAANLSSSSPINQSNIGYGISPTHNSGTSNSMKASLLDLAFSPVTNTTPNTYNPQVHSGSIPIVRGLIRSHNVMSALHSSPNSSHYQYQAACILNHSTDQQKSNISLISGGSPELSCNDLLSSSNRESYERPADEYWAENEVTSDKLDAWTLNLRKWLHGTIIKRIVSELDSLNKHFKEASGDNLIIGSITLTTLQQLCSTKYQYLPTIPILLAFLDCTKDQEYLVNRLHELARENSLQEFHWDSGSRSSLYPWKEHLPSDSLILLHLFATYMDTRMPPHPQCLTGRVFSQLNVVRYPDRPDLKSRHNCQIYQVSTQPPQFKLVLNGRIYTFPVGPKNLYHAILLCFHYYVSTSGKFRSVALGQSGLNVSWIFSKTN